MNYWIAAAAILLLAGLAWHLRQNRGEHPLSEILRPGQLEVLVNALRNLQ